MSEGCGRNLAEGQWFRVCGENDMGSLPALCNHCGGTYKLEYEPSPTVEPFKHKLPDDMIKKECDNRIAKAVDAFSRGLAGGYINAAFMCGAINLDEFMQYNELLLGDMK